MEKTIRLTVAQAIVKFLDQQYVCFDGKLECQKGTYQQVQWQKMLLLKKCQASY